MKLVIGPSVMRSYKRLPYKAWHALAEFVDNSTQDYFNHREELDAAFKDEGTDGMFVRINYDRDKGFIRISDTGYGMDEADLDRALKVGNPPENPNGRSRYGLGMKMAACWFGDEWKIITTKLGSTVEYTVTVEVESVASGDGTVKVTTATAPAEQHYTRIEISKMNGKLQGRTLGKTKNFIGSMYRPDIQSGDLTIEWDGVALNPELNFEFLKDALGNEFRKDFEMEVDGYKATGWVGILGRGSREKGGFAIRYQGRMIRTWPDAWKPAEIFGQESGTNDLRNQRLCGELILDAYDISHTKDDILWEGTQEDDFQDALKEIVGDWSTIANTPYKNLPLSPPAIAEAVEELNRELNSGEIKDLIENDLPSPEAIDADDKALIEETDQSKPDFSATLPLNDSKVEVVGFLDYTKSQNDPYVVWESSADGKVIVVINMRHPHLGSGVGRDALLSYLQHCTYDVLAEWRAAGQNAEIDGGTWRRWKDKFLRIGFAINMHDQ